VTEHNFQTMRQAMVENQLRTTAVSDPRVVAAMESVAREDFVPEDRRPLAYIDVLTPIAPGRSLNSPMATGRLLTEARLLASDSVLLIGAGTGYCAALLSALVASVVAVESDPELHRTATLNLASYANVSLIKADLADGNAGADGFDVLVIDGVIEHLPTRLITQLRDGARVVSGWLEGGVTRLAQGIKFGNTVKLIGFADAECAVLPGFGVPTRFSF
jgi:protein-L-isoaspartate(D-aspartate) O-methyltransferase